MRVIHLTSGPLDGGAAKGAKRLHEGLLSIGVDSTLVGFGANIEDKKVIDLKSIKNRIKRKVNAEWNDVVLKRYSDRRGDIFTVGNEIFNLYRGIDFSEYDVINLHWINYAISLNDIKRYASKYKLVWTMRDMWPFTGGCHYSLSCERYVEGCGFCKALSSKELMDISRAGFRRKSIVSGSIHYVAISNWLKDRAISSGLVADEKCSCIYNSVDTKVFNCKQSKESVREHLGIKSRKKIILIGAQNLSDEYKGGGNIRSLIEEYRDEFYFVFFGDGVDSLISDLLPFEHKTFGFVNESLLALLYRSSDLFLMLSTQEAFGKTVIESLASGTPVLTCANTAPHEIVSSVGLGRHTYGANLYDCMEEKPDVHLVGEKFGIDAIAKQYYELYKQI